MGKASRRQGAGGRPVDGKCCSAQRLLLALALFAAFCWLSYVAQWQPGTAASPVSAEAVPRATAAPTEPNVPENTFFAKSPHTEDSEVQVPQAAAPDRQVPQAAAPDRVGGAGFLAQSEFGQDHPAQAAAPVATAADRAMGGGPVRVRSTWWRASDADVEKSDAVARKRRAEVKAAMVHTWNGYKSHAWGRDEIKPGTGGYTEDWGGIGMTILDSLDTLWLLGMRQEFDEAMEWVRSPKLDFSRVGAISVFETTIRALGGLLGAHTLSGEDIFASRAQELGERLLPALQTSSGLADPWIRLSDGRSEGKRKTSLAEAGTLQLEFHRLSEVTGDQRFAEAAARAHDVFYQAFKKQKGVRGGLFPSDIALPHGKLSGTVSFGANGDSFYEYLLKCWMAQGHEADSPLLEMYEAAVDSLQRELVRTTPRDKLKYIAGEDGHRMEHLACFLPGLLALGAHLRPKAPKRDQEFALAEDLAYTCFEMYRRMPTGMAPEAAIFGKKRDVDFEADKPWSMWTILRPEAVESFFILHELTGDAKYRDWGHDVFRALDRTCKAPHGYGAHPDVTKPELKCCMGNDDKEPSFFLAETLKYLYLLQDPEHTLSLDSFVLNTEAHPFPLSTPFHVEV